MLETLNKMRLTNLVSEVKRVDNCPDFEKLAHVIQHGLQGRIVKNIEGESMEEYFVEGLLRK